jgi:hypothetical protein
VRAIVQTPLEALDPSPRVLRRRVADVPTPEVALLVVYRLRFAGLVSALCDAMPLGTRAALWGLDGVDPRLEAHTVGSGPGERLQLLNHLHDHLHLDPGAWTVMADDDVVIKRGTPATLVKAGVAFGLDLLQPVHAWNSEVSHRFTRRRALTLVRRTGWVEQGPMAVFGPRARACLLPFRATITWPGWGVEALWSLEERNGLALGMIDGVTMVHTQIANATRYSWQAAQVQERALLDEAGLDSMKQAQVTRRSWRPWDRAPHRPGPTAPAGASDTSSRPAKPRS